MCEKSPKADNPEIVNTLEGSQETPSLHIKQLFNTPRKIASALFDRELLGDVKFLVYATQRTSSYLVRTFPDMFLPSLAVSHGINKHKAVLLLTIQAITQMATRPLSGLISDLKGVSRLLFCVASSVGGGLAIVGVAFASTYIHFVIYAVAFGMCSGNKMYLIIHCLNYFIK